MVTKIKNPLAESQCPAYPKALSPSMDQPIPKQGCADEVYEGLGTTGGQLGTPPLLKLLAWSTFTSKKR